ncbi:hypothetical protein LCGC14_2406360 [marine sediment metagenome]|uniref:Uncharacterized protein n=1 Tax=marine sediment metagenome TaxID=412755 RepID=A0A0F9EN93_9ZZZZ
MCIGSTNIGSELRSTGTLQPRSAVSFLGFNQTQSDKLFVASEKTTSTGSLATSGGSSQQNISGATTAKIRRGILSSQ